MCPRDSCDSCKPRESMCRGKTCSPSPATTASIQRCLPRTSRDLPGTSAISIAASTAARIPATGRSALAWSPRSDQSFLKEGEAMKMASRHPLAFVAALMIAAAGIYGCDDFLNNAAEPQGTLDEQTLANKVGVEGSLIIQRALRLGGIDRKSTRLNSSHSQISYAVFCLKKKN